MPRYAPLAAVLGAAAPGLAPMLVPVEVPVEVEVEVAMDDVAGRDWDGFIGVGRPGVLLRVITLASPRLLRRASGRVVVVGRRACGVMIGS